MRRRELIAALGLALAIPWPVRAQQPAPVRRVGMLVAQAIEDDFEYEGRVSALVESLRDLGWVDGRNLKLSVYRAKPSPDEISKRIAELIAGNPELIVAGGGTTTGLLLKATSTIPILFTTAVDPVGNGFVESLSHPGRNATGFMQFDYSLSGKWLELLKQVSPAAARVGIVRDASSPAGIGQFAVLQSVAGLVGVDIFPIGTGDAAEIESRIAKLASAPNGGLVVTLGAGVNAHRDQIVGLAARYKLPAVYANRAFVDRGGLISYGSDTIASVKRAAAYVDRILKGEKPADLPVQAPNKYELVINLKTAKALGFDLPATLLARADEVIE
jgi:putative tryptophan/tyrosine transport system substrate-binding protein